MSADRSISESAAALRRAFDASFTRGRADDVVETTDFLSVLVGQRPCAIALSEVAIVHRAPRIVPVPSDAPHLLGVAAVRGSMVPVYELRGVVGMEGDSSPRWLVITAGASTLGLAVDACDGQLRAPTSDIIVADAPVRATCVRHSLRLQGGSRPIIHLASVIDAITRWGLRGAPKSKEQ